MGQINTCFRSHLENDMVLSVGGQKPEIFPSLSESVWLSVLFPNASSCTLLSTTDPKKQGLQDICVTNPQH